MNEKTVSQEFENYLEVLDELNKDPAFVNMLFLSQSCKNDITVAVFGDVGDELFAVYATFMGLKFVPFFGLLPNFIQSRLVQIADKLLAASDTYLGLQFNALAFFQGFPSSRIMRSIIEFANSLPDNLKLESNNPKNYLNWLLIDGVFRLMDKKFLNQLISGHLNGKKIIIESYST